MLRRCKGLVIIPQAQYQLRKLLAEQEQMFGAKDSGVLQAAINLMICSRKAKDQTYATLTPHLIHILANNENKELRFRILTFSIVDNLLDDKQYDRAYSLAMACVSAVYPNDDLGFSYDILWPGSFADHVQKAALFLATHGREEQGDKLYQSWIERVGKVIGANSIEIEHAYLFAPNITLSQSDLILQ
jgi:hypothetical protein